MYPKEARRREQEGGVIAQVRIDPRGVPIECRIVQSSGFAALDNGTCAGMMQMRFRPPDVDGKSVESATRLKFDWVLTDPRSFGPTWLRVELSLDEKGLASCNVEGGGPLFPAWSQHACAKIWQPYYLGADPRSISTATVEIELIPTGAFPLLTNRRAPTAFERVDFKVNSKGDPVDCQVAKSRGFGPRTLANSTSCGTFLIGSWFKKPSRGQPPHSGSVETRVFVVPRPAAQAPREPVSSSFALPIEPSPRSPEAPR